MNNTIAQNLIEIIIHIFNSIPLKISLNKRSFPESVQYILIAVSISFSAILVLMFYMSEYRFSAL